MARCELGCYGGQNLATPNIDRVAVGNEQARDLKAMSVPFSIGTNEEGLWNSLAVSDTGIVVAVSGLGCHSPTGAESPPPE